MQEHPCVRLSVWTVQLFDVAYKNHSILWNDYMAEFSMSHSYCHTFQSSNTTLALHLEQEFNQLLLVVTMWQELFPLFWNSSGFSILIFFELLAALRLHSAAGYLSVTKCPAIEPWVQAKFNNRWRFLSSWAMFCGMYFGLICCSTAIPSTIQTLPIDVSTYGDDSGLIQGNAAALPY